MLEHNAKDTILIIQIVMHLFNAYCILSALLYVYKHYLFAIITNAIVSLQDKQFSLEIVELL